VRHLSRHLKRLSSSASALGFKLADEASLREQIAAQVRGVAVANRAPDAARAEQNRYASDYRCRIVATNSIRGRTDRRAARAGSRDFAATQAGDPLLLHKTTRRAEYDRGWREAEAKGAFDTLFFNERDELTEGGRRMYL
jgi:para-aminobenzoate synthetase/4-amino-4-deoxychorismate lyase